MPKLNGKRLGEGQQISLPREVMEMQAHISKRIEQIPRSKSTNKNDCAVLKLYDMLAPDRCDIGKAQEFVEKRILQLESAGGDTRRNGRLNYNQRLELQVMLGFGIRGRLPQETRERAKHLLRTRGVDSDRAFIEEICREARS